mgnify:CR=1 FL=1
MDRDARGRALLLRMGGPEGMAPLDALMDTAPDIVRFAVGFAYGEVLSRPDLDLPTRQLCTVGALTALGHATLQLDWHRQAALRVGATAAGYVSGVATAATTQSGNLLTNDTDPDGAVVGGTTHTVTDVSSSVGTSWNKTSGTSFAGRYGSLKI